MEGFYRDRQRHKRQQRIGQKFLNRHKLFRGLKEQTNPSQKSCYAKNARLNHPFHARPQSRSFGNLNPHPPIPEFACLNEGGKVEEESIRPMFAASRGQVMKKQFRTILKPILKTLMVFSLAFTLMFSQMHDAMAAPARGGGRIGGGSFRSAPSRSYSAPRSGGYSGGYGYGGGGGFFFFPSPWMFLGGGGSLFTLLIVIAIASFLFQNFRRTAEGDEFSVSSSTVSVAKLQVGLLADARSLQQELNQIATRAQTGSTAGLAKVLQETTLALLRHPEYWVYAGGEAKQARLESAEAEFNRLALAERSKVSGETLSNVAGELKQKNSSAIAVADPAGALAESEPGAYIVVTLLVGTQGKLDLPTIHGDADVRQALNQLGAVSSDRLLALEVLWTPQAAGDVLTRDDMVTDYPSLKLV
jgi:uncharacterized membrane protein